VGALSDERTGLSFVCAAGSCQLSLSRVIIPWDLRPYFTVSDLRLPFSSPPTTRRVTVEEFDPASTRVWIEFTKDLSFISSGGPNRSYGLPVSVVAEMPDDPKILRIYGNIRWIFVDMRMNSSDPLPSKWTFACSLLFRLSGGLKT
jgi:hypothetical protein